MSLLERFVKRARGHVLSPQKASDEPTTADDDDMSASPAESLHSDAPAPATNGFLSGRGHELVVSAEQLEAASKKLGPADADDTAGGFLSGTGRKLVVSEAKLRAAQMKLLDGADDDDNQPSTSSSSSSSSSPPPLPATDGFVSGVGRRLNVSEARLRAAQRKLDEGLAQSSEPAAGSPQPVDLSSRAAAPKKLDFGQPAATRTPPGGLAQRKRSAPEPPTSLQFSVAAPFRLNVAVAYNAHVYCSRCDSTLVPPGAPFCAWCGMDQSSAAGEHPPPPASRPAVARVPEPPRTPPAPSFPYPKRSRIGVESPVDSKRRGYQKPFSPPSRFAVPTTPSSRPTPPSPLSAPSPSSMIMTTTATSAASTAKFFDLALLAARRRPSLQQAVGGGLPHLYTVRDLTTLWHLPDDVARMTLSTAVGYRMDGGSVGCAELRHQLIGRGARPDLCSPAWAENHYALIVWKLASLERTFPRQFAGSALNVASVFAELCYRYERDVQRAQRSLLCQIYERDETPTKHMVVCVSKIRPPPPSADDYGAATIEVTDGWYVMPADLDPALSDKARQGRIFAGQKLRIFGATLSGPPDACPPLQAPDTVRLQLSINGTRRCKWFEKLGAQRTPAFHVPLSSIVAGGGTVPAIDVIVQRVYPVRYLERLADGRRVSRNRHSEETAQLRHAERLEAAMQQARESLAREEMARARQPPAKEQRPAAALLSAHSGEDIAALLETASDPDSLLAMLTPVQRQQLEQHRARAAQETEARLQQYMERVVAETPDLQRDGVSPYLCVKVTDCMTLNTSHALLTVWRPNEQHLHDFVEGNRLSIYGLQANRRSDALSTSSFTKWTVQQLRPEHRCRVVPRAYCQLFERLTDIEYRDQLGNREFDCAGVLLAVGSLGSQSFDDGRVIYSQNLFLSDTRSILVVALQGDADIQFAYTGWRGEFSLDDPVVLLCRNLHYREYDSDARVHVAAGNNLTEIIPAVGNRLAAVRDLAERLHCKEAVQVLPEQLRHINALAGQIDVRRRMAQRYETWPANEDWQSSLSSSGESRSQNSAEPKSDVVACADPDEGLGVLEWMLGMTH